MSSATRLTLFRAMHSSGRSLNRQIPHPPLGRAGDQGPGGSHAPVPENTISHPAAPQPSSPPTVDPIVAESTTPSHVPSIRPSAHAPIWSHKGKKIPIRPRRTIPVDLPHGLPEPDSWPPSKEYLEKVKTMEPRKPHALWQFFQPSAGMTAPLDEQMMQPPHANVTGTQPSAEAPDEIRAWSAAELRLKSFADLHTLWYVLLKEGNVLATQREERRRLEIDNRFDRRWMFERRTMVRKSMARIKFVLQERRLGLIAAVAPQLPSRSPLPPWADPTGSQKAIWGKTEFEDVRVPRAVRWSRKHRTYLSAKAVADDVAEAEVESRDEGFGGGEEAKEFVEKTKVEADGRVMQA